MSRHRESPDSLTDFEELFCREYAKDLSATEAYIKAGFKGTRRSAGVEASKLLKKPMIVEKIRTLMQRRFDKFEVSAERVLRELARVAYGDMDDFAVVENGKLRLLDSKDRKPGRSRIIKKISQSESESHGETDSSSMSQSLELHDKMKALELLGKHLKMFTDKVEHSGKLSLADLVAGSNEEGKEE